MDGRDSGVAGPHIQAEINAVKREIKLKEQLLNKQVGNANRSKKT